LCNKHFASATGYSPVATSVVVLQL